MNPSAIICSDIHLREDSPACRTDDFYATQLKKIDFIRGLADKYKCPVLDGGDLFHRWKSSPRLLRDAIRHLPHGMITVAGNHDLPQHSMELYHKSSLAVVEAAEVVKVGGTHDFSGFVVNAVNWDSEFPEAHRSERQVLITHFMTYHNEEPWPGAAKKITNARGWLEKLEGWDLIIVGHNHQPFIVEDDKGRKLISPGSLMRTTITQKDYKPQVYLWYADDNTLKPAEVPLQSKIEIQEESYKGKEQDERLRAYIERLREDVEIGVSFVNNLERYLTQHDTHPMVKQVIEEVIKDG